MSPPDWFSKPGTIRPRPPAVPERLAVRVAIEVFSGHRRTLADKLPRRRKIGRERETAVIPKGEQWSEIAGVAGGDLAVTSYAVLLAAMARSGRTGGLLLVRKPVTKEIFLVEGRPVGCRSNLVHETFGRFLRSEGLLSEEDYRSALSDSLSREIPLGEVLVQRGLLSPQEVYKNLQKNLARKLLDGFTWDRGEYKFVEDDGSSDTTVKINAPQLILTGVLKLTPRAEIDAGVARLRREPVSLDPQPIFEDTQLRLAGRSERVVRALRSQPLGLVELASAVSLPGEELDRVVYALALLGLVLPASEVAERKLTRSDQRTQPKGPAQRSPSDVALESDQELLLRQTKIVEAYLSFRRKDSLDFFELEETCTAPEIDRAYLSAAETYAPWSLTAMGVSDFAEQGELLFLKAAQAYAEITNSESRGALIHRRKVVRDQESDRKKTKFTIATDLLDSEDQFKKGVVLAEQGELRRALELLEFAVDCDPQSALYRAELAYRRDQFEPSRFRKQSIIDLEEAVRIDPGCGEAHYYLGLLLGSKNDLAGAEAALCKSIKLMAPDRRPIEALREFSVRKKR